MPIVGGHRLDRLAESILGDPEVPVLTVSQRSARRPAAMDDLVAKVVKRGEPPLRHRRH
jgi:hypothetical protein